MQRRTTRVTSRQTIAENAPSARQGASRSTTSKLRAGSAGLSVAKPQDPNTNTGASSKTSKPTITKDAGTTSAAVAPIKRKREALSENVGAKTVRPKVVVDKENRVSKKETTAYVEVPSVAVARSRTTTTSTATRTTTSTAAATRNRIIVKRDEEVPAKRVKEEPRQETSIPIDPKSEGAMSIDEPDVHTRSSTRHASVRSSAAASSHHSHTSARRTSTSVKKPSTTAPTSTRSTRRTVKREETVELEVEPVHKKRRTSSVGPDEKPAPLEEHHSPLVEFIEEAKETAAQEEVKWDDLDQEDEADPLMVSEYVVEIFEYLRKLELLTMPNPNYIDMQKDLAWKMRGILMDWLIQVHGRFRLLPETLFLAVNIIDRFLSSRVVSLVRLQLVGITAMFIAAKYEEVMAPSVSNFIYCSDSTYTEKDILDAEKYILRSIDYNLSYPNPINFLRRSSKADGYDLQVRTVAKYLIEIACVDWRLLPHEPSKIAAAGIWLARLILEKDEWTPNLAHYSGWDEKGLLPAAQLMVIYLLRPVKHESFYKKYAAKKYMKVSSYVRDWLWGKFGAVMDYDGDGEPTTGPDIGLSIVTTPGSISLADELPRLREEIQRYREQDEALMNPANEDEI